MKKLCVFQMHHTDISEHLKKYNAVTKIKKSGIFDQIVVAVPDVPENKRIERFTKMWGAEIFYGDVNNVVKRLNDVAEKYDCDIIARALVWWFFIDTKLIKRMINTLIRTNADYVNLPYNFDIRFGADVFTKEFIDKVLKLSNKNGMEFLKFNPFGYVENHREYFNILTEKNIPTFGKTKFYNLKGLMKQIWPERWDFTNAPMVPYEEAVKILKGKGKALDISCGYGAGTKVLAKGRTKVIGIDNCPETIRKTKKLCKGFKNITLITSDVYELNFDDEEFDVIISVHTMEHLKNDKRFLKLVNNWLKKNGTFILEVPLRTTSPFTTVKTPIRPFHEREYTIKELRNLFSKEFKIINGFGVSRGYYGSEKNARDAAMYMLKKKN